MFITMTVTGHMSSVSSNSRKLLTQWLPLNRNGRSSFLVWATSKLGTWHPMSYIASMSKRNASVAFLHPSLPPSPPHWHGSSLGLLLTSLFLSFFSFLSSSGLFTTWVKHHGGLLLHTAYSRGIPYYHIDVPIGLSIRPITFGSQHTCTSAWDTDVLMVHGFAIARMQEMILYTVLSKE